MIQKNAKLLLMMLAFTAIFISCGDEIVDPVSSSPKISFGGTTGNEAKVKPCEPVTMSLVASKGNSELNAIEVLEDGVKVAIDRITFKGAAVGGNPILLVGADRSALAADLIVKASCAVGSKNITVSISDASNAKTSATKKVTTEATSPSSKYNGPATVDAVPGVVNNFNFDVTKGSGKIISVEVQEASVKIADLTRLSFDGKPFTANPEALAAAFQPGFVAKSVGVKTPTAPGTYKYNFIFKDEFGLATQQEVSVKVGVPTTFMKVGAFFNIQGTNFGGLDLDDALNVAQNSSLSEVEDLGLNTDPDKAKNWKQEIKGVNGTSLKVLKRAAEVESTFTLSSVVFVDQIAALYAKGKDLAAGQKIVKGDIITAQKTISGVVKYYIFEVTDVIVTPNDNNDKYQVDIKH
jgi:hypothetical protein